MAGDRPKQPA